MGHKTPAERLKGYKLEGGWEVVEMIETKKDSSGGNFSCSYKVKDASGKEAFLKAIDYKRAFGSSDIPTKLLELLKEFQFERDILEKCEDSNFDRVVKYLSFGQVVIKGLEVPGIPNAVNYLILELAENDLRGFADISKRVELAWLLRSLHHVAVGMKQLHSVGIAHQDLKPSNIMVFGKEVSKVGDLGSSSEKGKESPRDKYHCAGDPSYAPPELLYGHIEPNWKLRRVACDIYLLGSIVVFMFTRMGMTPLLMSELNKDHRPLRFEGGYNGSYEDVLTYVRDAHIKAITRLEEDIEVYDPSIAVKLSKLVAELCDPDPKLRGYRPTKQKYFDPLSLDRCVTLFDSLAGKAEKGVLVKVI